MGARTNFHETRLSALTTPPRLVFQHYFFFLSLEAHLHTEIRLKPGNTARFATPSGRQCRQPGDHGCHDHGCHWCPYSDGCEQIIWTLRLSKSKLGARKMSNEVKAAGKIVSVSLVGVPLGLECGRLVPLIF